MKKLFFAALMMVSILSMAHAARINANMSWDKIKKTDGVIIRYTSIQVQGVFITVDKFCVNGDVIVADSNYKACVEWSDVIGENDATCLRYEEVLMEKPIVYTENTCTEWTNNGDDVVCTKYEMLEKRLPITSQAEVYFNKGIGENPEIHLFNKAYTIPACK
jgi:hypothetical protein